MIELQAGPFKTAHDAGNRSYACRAVFTFSDETTLEVRDGQIWDGSFRFDNAVSGQSAFEIGACIINQLSFTLNNITGDYDGCTFAGAQVVAYIGLYDSEGALLPQTDGGTDYWIQKGVYYVDEVDTNGDLIKLTCLDAMANFDVPLSELDPADWHSKNSQTGEPTQFSTPWLLFHGICDYCGVPTDVVERDIIQFLNNANYTLFYQFNANQIASLSCRDALSALCQFLGVYATIDRFGLLRLMYIRHQGTVHEMTTAAMTQFSRSETDVIITGIIITATDGKIYSRGSDAYPIQLDQNMINSGYADKVAQGLYRLFAGMTFRPFEATHLPDVTIEAGDNIRITDRAGNVYQSVITHTEFSPGRMQTTECNADPAAAASGTRYSAAAKAISRAAVATYEALPDKPSINSVTLEGNQTGDTLGLVDETDALSNEEIEALLAQADS